MKKPQKLHQTKSFQKLRDHWYDIINQDKDSHSFSTKIDDELSPYASYVPSELKRLDNSGDMLLSKFNDTLQYYTNASRFFHQHNFKQEKHRIIWKLHISGMSLRKISTELIKQRYKKCSHQSVKRTINKLQQHMQEFLEKEALEIHYPDFLKLYKFSNSLHKQIFYYHSKKVNPKTACKLLSNSNNLEIQRLTANDFTKENYIHIRDNLMSEYKIFCVDLLEKHVHIEEFMAANRNMHL